MAVLSGEAVDVDQSIVSDRSSHLQSMCNGYALKDIMLMRQAFSSSIRLLAIKGDEAKEGKIQKRG